jgi:ABC-2 type transport system ATP-binding protein
MSDAAHDRPVIEAKGLTKTFVVATGRAVRRMKRETVAVDALDLRIERGSFVALIGPNGAGKSTAVKMLTGILAPTAGHLRVLGFEPLRQRTALAAHIGVVFGQRSQLWWDLPLQDSFTLLRHLYRVPTADFADSLSRMTDQFDLGPLLARPVRTLSLGQRMRAELAAALLHRPELLFLDEPTIGLDIVAKQAMRDALRSLHQVGDTTVVLTTHDLDDVEELCERVVIVDRGRVVRDQSLAALHAELTVRRQVPATDHRQPARSGVPDLESLVRSIYQESAE